MYTTIPPSNSTVVDGVYRRFGGMSERQIVGPGFTFSQLSVVARPALTASTGVLSLSVPDIVQRSPSGSYTVGTVVQRDVGHSSRGAVLFSALCSIVRPVPALFMLPY